MILRGWLTETVGQPRLFLFPGMSEVPFSGSTKGRQPRLSLRSRDNSVREPNAQPAPATGLFKGFGVLPQQAEKQTFGGNAGSLFRAFVYTNALLATMVTPPKKGEMTVLCSGPHLSYNGREPD